jgi:hypothetical protein
MAKEKNKPVPVRFDLKLMEVLKEEEKIDTPQQALNFLARFWEDNRPAKTGPGSDSPGSDLKEGGSSEVSTVKKSAKVAKSNASDAGNEIGRDIGKAKKGEPMAHPSGLSGIDLSIWKAEQKEKNKEA